MSKRKKSKRSKPAAKATGRGRLFVVISLIAALAVTGAILAGRALSGGSPPDSEMSAVTPPIPAPPVQSPSPGKEYIYSAGKLVSTEEPAGGGPSCSFSINPTSQSFAASGGTGSVGVTVTSGSGCNWTATSNATWITITAGASGTGNGTVFYSVAVNSITSPRSGTMTVAGLTLTVDQAAASGGCTYSINPTSQSIGA
ncbi:MAG: BACON domain-containing protein, partial [Blastocatellia bacterium]|nr:BACON domain-containing protein [Blastocatellia bacterium]